MVSVNAPVILPRLIAGYPGHVSEIQQMPYGVGTTFPELVDVIARWIPEELIPYMISLNKNNDQVVDILNKALTDQTASVMSQLATVLAEIIAGENVELNDGSIRAALESVNSVTIAYLDNLYAPQSVADDVAKVRRFYAPDPDGTDQTAVLLSAANLAVTTRGELVLSYGTYKANLDLSQSVIQPRIKGMGRHHTIIQPADKTKPIVKFNGGSGTAAGGGLFSIGLDGTDRHTAAYGLMFAGCGSVTAHDVEINGCGVAVAWANSRPSEFTEFCTFEGSIYNCINPFQYIDGNNVESFHGSGPVGNTIVGMASDATGAVIGTIGDALPYNAPLSLTVFWSNSAQSLINYQNTAAGRHASFYGFVRMENSSILGDGAQLGHGQARVYLIGGISDLGAGGTVLGNIFLVSKVSYEQGTVYGELLPVTARQKLKSTPTQLFGGVLNPGEAATIAVHITGSGFDEMFILDVYQGLYNGAGAVNQRWHPADINDANISGTAFSWNNGLYISGNFPDSGYTAFARLTVLGGQPTSTNLAQLAG